MSGRTIDNEHRTFEITSGFQYLCVGDSQPTTSVAGITNAFAKIKILSNKSAVLSKLETLGKDISEKIKGADFGDVGEMNKGVGVDLDAVLDSLGGAGYTSVLVEGGSGVIASFVEQRLFDKIVTYVGNILIGGQDALSAVGGQGATTLADAVPLQFEAPTTIGDNIRIEGYYRERKGAYVYGDC